MSCGVFSDLLRTSIYTNLDCSRMPGTGLSKISVAIEKTAELAPTPSATIARTLVVSEGWEASRRSAYRRCQSKRAIAVGESQL